MGVADGVVSAGSEEEDSIGTEVDDTGLSLEDSTGEGDGDGATDGERVGDCEGSREMDSDGTILLDGCSKTDEELTAIRLDTPRDSVASLDRIGFTFTRIGRRLAVGLVRTWLLVTRMREDGLGPAGLERISLLRRGVSRIAELD